MREMTKSTCFFKVGPKKVGIGGKKLKYVARPYYVPKQSENDTIEQIVRNFDGLRPYQVRGVVDAIVNDFHNQIMKGHPMKIAGLGTFRLSFNSTSRDTPEGFTSADILNPHIIFTPEKKLKNYIQTHVVFEEAK